MPAQGSDLVPGGRHLDTRGLSSPRYRGDLPPEPFDRREGGAGQPVGTQARDGDEGSTAHGKLTRLLTLSGVIGFE